MDARDYLKHAKENERVLVLARYDDTENCLGTGRALIIDPDERIAVMLEHCGLPGITLIRGGNLVKYSALPEEERRILGDPADIQF